MKEKQKVVALLSGGFDSPVAAFMMMKRGCSSVLVHFQNENQLKDSVEDKVQQLAIRLAKFQPYTKLYIVPFADIQKQIIMKIRSETRMLIYRKFMIRIASEIAKQEKADFLVTGDNLSQVASQTLSNLRATYADSARGILTPLIGMDKTEIMALARRIGTYKLSELPYGDCCSYFVPKHPDLRSTVGVLNKLMDSFDAEMLIEKAIGSSKVLEF